MSRLKLSRSLCLALLLIHAAAWAQDQTARTSLAERVIAAASEAERDALLAAEKGALSPALIRTLISEKVEALRRQGEYAKALAVCRTAQVIGKQIGDEAGVALAVQASGVMQEEVGRYDLALEAYRQALAIRERLGDKAGMAHSLNGIGVAYYHLEEYDQSQQYYERSLALREELGNQAGIGAALSNLGVLAFSRGDYVKAMDYYQRSLRIREEIKDLPGIAISLSNLSLVHRNQGNFDLAFSYSRRALELDEASGDKAAYASSLNGLGGLYNLTGDYALALQYLRRALELREALGHKTRLATTLTSIGNSYFYQGNYDLAQEYYRRSLELCQAAGQKSGTATAYINTAAVMVEQGRYEAALEFYRKGLAICVEQKDQITISGTENNIGDVYEMLKDYPQALVHYRQSYAIRESMDDKEGMAESLAGLSSVARAQGQHQEALAQAERAASLADQVGSRELFWQARSAAGQAYVGLRQPASARQAFDEAISTIEAIRNSVAGGEEQRERFFENKVSPYRAVVELLVAQGEAEPALAYAERSRARVLTDVLRSGRINVTKAMTPAEQDEERRLNNDLVSLNTQLYREKLREKPDPARLTTLDKRLQSARLKQQDFLNRLYDAHPDLRAQRGQAGHFELKQAAALLPTEHTALLEYVLAEQKAFLFVLTREAGQAVPQLKVYELPADRLTLTTNAQGFRTQLARHDLTFGAKAAELYAQLLKPAEAQLRGKTHLVIVPDGALWELPFQALRRTPQRFLIEDFAISYAPSLTVLAEMVKTRGGDVRGRTLLAFGNPALGPGAASNPKLKERSAALSPLPEAETEVRSLAQVYGVARSKVFVGAAAREDRFKAEAEKYRVIHLAAHGLLNDASPMYSQIVLSQTSPSPTEDGLLEAWELMKLDLKSDLVILSACETARGRVGAGEGVIGLTWALFVAGSPATLVSQWKVDAASTSELMRQFHRDWQTARPGSVSPTKAAALRGAALKLIASKQYRHPFYWAGFVLVGNGF